MPCPELIKMAMILVRIEFRTLYFERVIFFSLPANTMGGSCIHACTGWQLQALYLHRLQYIFSRRLTTLL